MNLIKNIPNDIKQAIYSLFVSVMLISGALFMLSGYLDTVTPKDDAVEAAINAEETEAESTT
jgi:hypothetical protein